MSHAASAASSSQHHAAPQRRAPTPLSLTSSNTAAAVTAAVYAYNTPSDSTPSNMSGSSPYDPEHSRHLPDPLPSIPSTFLPSYYPESRNNDILPSYLSQTSPNFGGKDLPPIPMDYYPPEGSGGRHMLEGVALSNIPRPPRNHGVPTYELSPSEFGGVPPGVGPWRPKERAPWSESFPFDDADSYDRTRNVGAGGFQMQEGEGSGSTYPRQSQSGNGSGGGFNGLGFPPPPNTTNRGAYQGMDETHANGPHAREDFGGGSHMGAQRPINLSGEDYAEAVGMYDHILGALPYIQPSDASHDPNAQSFDSLMHLANQGADILSGARPRGVDASVNGGTAPKSVLGKRGSVAQGKQTKCLGCGATETPEWRRGPLGPRTLCNACGLVHMKMVRRQKREAEKEKARNGQ